MPNLPPPLVLPVVSIMRRYGNIFFIFGHLLYRLPSQVHHEFSSSKASDPTFVGFIYIASRCTNTLVTH